MFSGVKWFRTLHTPLRLVVLGQIPPWSPVRSLDSNHKPYDQIVSPTTMLTAITAVCNTVDDMLETTMSLHRSQVQRQPFDQLNTCLRQYQELTFCFLPLTDACNPQ